MNIVTLGLEEVRDEFLRQVIPTIQGKVSQAQFEGMLGLLDNFLSLVKANNILLIKIIEDVQEQPQPEPQPREGPLVIPRGVVQKVKEVVDVEQESQEEVEEPLTQEEMFLREQARKKRAEPEKKEPTNFTSKIKQYKVNEEVDDLEED